jgi:hypothetical protein
MKQTKIKNMKIVIKPKDDSSEEISSQEEMAQEQPKQTVLSKPPMNVTLNVRRGLDGRLIIRDHDHIDIVYLPEKKKIIAFAKQDYSDITYETQDRLFDFLVDKGICMPESIQAGNVYGSLEANVLVPKDEIPLEHLLSMNLEKWLKSEKPALDADERYKKEFEKTLTDPSEEESTELGEVPQEEDKGSIPRYASRRYIGGWW